MDRPRAVAVVFALHSRLAAPGLNGGRGYCRAMARANDGLQSRSILHARQRCFSVGHQCRGGIAPALGDRGIESQGASSAMDADAKRRRITAMATELKADMLAA